MEKNSYELLEQAIRNQINNLDYLDYGSPEMAKAINDIDKLYRLKMDETDKANTHANKRMEIIVNKRSNFVKVGVAAAEIVLPLMFYGFWLRKGFKFEETGVFTSTTFKGLFNRCLKPTKK